jgi:hypothetical protein
MSIYASKKEVLQNIDQDGFLSEKVFISVTEILEMNSLEFVDFLSEEIVGSTGMEEIDFEALEIVDGSIAFAVRGNVRNLLSVVGESSVENI